MASNKVVAEQLITLLDDILENEYSGDSNRIMYCGKVYTRGDFDNFKALLKYAQYRKKKHIETTSDYLKINKEYNRLQRMKTYYTKKKNKTENDFIKIEEIEIALKEVSKDRELKKKISQEKKYKQLEKDYKNFISGERNLEI